MDEYIDVAALGKVLLASVVAGVGLVSLFGVGLVGLAEHHGQMASGTDSPQRGSGLWLLLAGLCFTVVLLGAALGVYHDPGLTCRWSAGTSATTAGRTRR